MIHLAAISTSNALSLRRLRLLALALPALFVTALLGVSLLLLPQYMPAWAAFVIGVAAGSTGIYAFTRAVFDLIENLAERLAQETESASVLRERQRIALELHDGAIQALYGVGLSLEDCIERVHNEPEAVQEDLDGAIERLNAIIRNIRSYIFELQPQHAEDKPLSETLAGLLRDHEVNALMTTELALNGQGDPTALLSRDQAAGLISILHHILEGIRRRSRATHVAIAVGLEERQFELRLMLDGLGITADLKDFFDRSLTQIRQEAQSLGGEFILELISDHASAITVRVSTSPEDSRWTATSCA